MFLDPSGIEGASWDGEVASMKNHKKVMGMVYLKAFCKKYLDDTDFVPEFWNMPFSREMAELVDSIAVLAPVSTRTTLFTSSVFRIWTTRAWWWCEVIIATSQQAPVS